MLTVAIRLGDAEAMGNHALCCGHGVPMTDPDGDTTGAATTAWEAPTAKPTSAACKAGASLTPSPQYPTTCPIP